MIFFASSGLMESKIGFGLHKIGSGFQALHKTGVRSSGKIYKTSTKSKGYFVLFFWVYSFYSYYFF